MVCGHEFEWPEPQMCCDGRECGCRGLPVDPIVCSEECYNNLPFKKLEQRKDDNLEDIKNHIQSGESIKHFQHNTDGFGED